MVSKKNSYRPSQKKDIGSNRGGGEFYTGDILKYFEDLKFASNKEFGPKDIFEIACSKMGRDDGAV
jgi:hypothetical protein